MQTSSRAFFRRVLDAARMVERTRSPWWICWLTVNAWTQDEIARGIAPTRDLFYGYRSHVVSGEAQPALPLGAHT